MKTIIKTTGFMLLLVAVLQSCTKDNVNEYNTMDNCTDTVSFAAKIQPLILQNCATSGCHDATTQESGYDLTNHTNISANANIILSTMRWENGVVQMPYNLSQLPDSLIQQFSCWVKQGKLDN